ARGHLALFAALLSAIRRDTKICGSGYERSDAKARARYKGESARCGDPLRHSLHNHPKLSSAHAPSGKLCARRFMDNADAPARLHARKFHAHSWTRRREFRLHQQPAYVRLERAGCARVEFRRYERGRYEREKRVAASHLLLSS